jgi:hypothetical protein
MDDNALTKCHEECRKWHNDTLAKCSDAQRVEYHRLVAFFDATKEYYRASLDDAAAMESKIKTERRLAFIGGILVILALSFDLIESIFTQLTLGVGFTILVYFVVVMSVSQRETLGILRSIERDFATLGISLVQVYKSIEREQTDEAHLDHDTMTDSEKFRSATERALLNYHFRNIILDRVTNFEHGAMTPHCTNEVLSSLNT